MKQITKIHSRSAFTFIELMIASAIFVMLAAAIYLSFSVGVRSWRKIEDSCVVRQEARHVLTLVSRELRCASRSTLIAFDGDEHSVSFCSSLGDISCIKYEYNKRTGVIERIRRTYTQYVSGEDGKVSTIAEGVSGLEFLYSYNNDGDIEWRDAWRSIDGEMPFGVCIKLSLKPRGFAAGLELSKIVIIPTGILREGGE